MFKQKLIIPIIVIVVVAGLAAVALNLPEQEGAPTGEEAATGELPGEAPLPEEGAAEPSLPPGVEPTPENVKVPEPGEVVPKGIAVPGNVVDVGAEGGVMFRSFDITAENEAYSPSTIIVNQNDIIHINFTAIDKKYDLVVAGYRLEQVAEKGQTKLLEFQATEQGKFTFYSDLYGGIDGKMKGYIIVIK